MPRVKRGASSGIRTSASPIGQDTRTRRKTTTCPPTTPTRLMPKHSSSGGGSTSAPEAQDGPTICRPVLRLRRPSEDSLRELLSSAQPASLTSREVGATRAEQMPSGYRHDRYEAELGEGGAFERAAAALLAWQAQVGAGVEVYPSGSQVEEGATVVLLLRAGLWAPAPCRVVDVIDEPDRAGFA